MKLLKSILVASVTATDNTNGPDGSDHGGIETTDFEYSLQAIKR